MRLYSVMSVVVFVFMLNSVSRHVVLHLFNADVTTQLKSSLIKKKIHITCNCEEFYKPV